MAAFTRLDDAFQQAVLRSPSNASFVDETHRTRAGEDDLDYGVYEEETEEEGDSSWLELPFLRCSLLASSSGANSAAVTDYEEASQRVVAFAHNRAMQLAAPVSMFAVPAPPPTRGGLIVAARLVGCGDLPALLEPGLAAARQEQQLWRLTRLLLHDYMEASPDFVPNPTCGSSTRLRDRVLRVAAALPVQRLPAVDGLLRTTLLQRDAEVRLVHTVVEWLEEGARDDAGALVRQPPDDGAPAAAPHSPEEDATAPQRDIDMWAGSRDALLLPGGAAAAAGGCPAGQCTLSALDPDAPFRSLPQGSLDGPVVPFRGPAAAFLTSEDLRREAELSGSLWALLRSGQRVEAQDLAARYGQPWRAGVMAGDEAIGGPSGHLFASTAARAAGVAAAATAAPGGPSAVPTDSVADTWAAFAAEALTLWALAGSGGSRGGADGGALAAAQARVCITWEDQLWLRLNSLKGGINASAIGVLRAAQGAANRRHAGAPPSHAPLFSAAAAVDDAPGADVEAPLVAMLRCMGAASGAVGAGAAPYVLAVGALARLGIAMAARGPLLTSPQASLAGGEAGEDGALFAALGGVMTGLRDAVMAGLGGPAASASAAAGSPYAAACAANRGAPGHASAAGVFACTSPDALLLPPGGGALSSGQGGPVSSAPLPPACLPLLRFAAHALVFLRSPSCGLGATVRALLDRGAGQAASAAAAAAVAAHDDVLYLYHRHLCSASGVLPRRVGLSTGGEGPAAPGAEGAPLVDAAVFTALRFASQERSVRALTALLVALPFHGAAPAAPGSPLLRTGSPRWTVFAAAMKLAEAGAGAEGAAPRLWHIVSEATARACVLLASVPPLAPRGGGGLRLAPGNSPTAEELDAWSAQANVPLPQLLPPQGEAPAQQPPAGRGSAPQAQSSTTPALAAAALARAGMSARDVVRATSVELLFMLHEARREPRGSPQQPQGAPHPEALALLLRGANGLARTLASESPLFPQGGGGSGGGHGAVSALLWLAVGGAGALAVWGGSRTAAAPLPGAAGPLEPLLAAPILPPAAALRHGAPRDAAAVAAADEWECWAAWAAFSAARWAWRREVDAGTPACPQEPAARGSGAPSVASFLHNRQQQLQSSFSGALPLQPPQQPFLSHAERAAAATAAQLHASLLQGRTTSLLAAARAAMDACGAALRAPWGRIPLRHPSPQGTGEEDGWSRCPSAPHTLPTALTACVEAAVDVPLRTLQWLDAVGGGRGEDASALALVEALLGAAGGLQPGGPLAPPPQLVSSECVQGAVRAARGYRSPGA